MSIIEIKPVFRIDDNGDIVAPSGNVFVDRDHQISPGVFHANVEMLNLVYHYGMSAAVTEKLVEKARDRERIDAARAWLETDDPPPDPVPDFPFRVGAVLDVGPRCEAKGQCACDDGCGACHGCGRWLGREPDRIKKER